MTSAVADINIDTPRFDQTTFVGRFKHFLAITNPINILKTDDELRAAKALVESHRINPHETQATADELYTARDLYLSAYHPDTGELGNLVGRMSFQVYGGTVLCGAMMIFYHSTPAVVFWQWANQSFNAMVNYTNRNAKSKLTTNELGIAYVSATAAGVSTSLGLKAFLAKRSTAGGLVQRLVPLVALMAGNCVNIPLMRQNELSGGVTLVDERESEKGKSQFAAAKGISQVVLSRNFIGGTPMLIVPMVMSQLQHKRWFVSRQGLLNIRIQVGLTSLILINTVPIGCALYPQRSSISVETLKRWEPKVYEEIKKNELCITDFEHRVFYFNKGL